MQYNCIELFQKEDDGKWRVIHSTWSFIRPMDMNFDTAKKLFDINIYKTLPNINNSVIKAFTENFRKLWL